MTLYLLDTSIIKESLIVNVAFVLMFSQSGFKKWSDVVSGGAIRNYVGHLGFKGPLFHQSYDLIKIVRRLNRWVTKLALFLLVVVDGKIRVF